MSIEELITGSIEEIDNELECGNRESYKKLCDRLISKYKPYISDIDNNLDKDLDLTGYSAYYGDYKENLVKIKDKLIVYLAMRNEENKNHSKEYKQPPVSVNVTNTSSSDNHSTNTNNNTNTATVDLKVVFEQARKIIDDDESLNDNEVSEIMERINQLEELASSDENKRSKWNKCKEVMTWLFEKGAKVAGTILPLIIEIIK